MPCFTTRYQSAKDRTSVKIPTYRTKILIAPRKCYRIRIDTTMRHAKGSKSVPHVKNSDGEVNGHGNRSASPALGDY